MEGRGGVDSRRPIRGGTPGIGQRGRGGKRKQAPSFSPGIEGQNPSLPELSKKRRRNRNWATTETTAIIDCMKKGDRFVKGKFMIWHAITEEIEKVSGFSRSKGECQNRSDTLWRARNEVKKAFGDNYKQFFQLKEEDRPVKLPTHLTEKWYEDLEQIKQQQQKKPRHLSSSDSDWSPSLGGTQTPSRSDLAEDAGSSGTDLISSPENSPSPDPNQFQDLAVPYQTHSSELTEPPLQQMPQGPATPNHTGVAQDPTVPIQNHSSESIFQQMGQGAATPNQVVHPTLHGGEDSGALWGLDHAPSDLEWALAWVIQEEEDRRNFSAQNSCEATP